ncbi:hypothetical protein D3C75_1044430 [compost metagenome]
MPAPKFNSPPSAWAMSLASATRRPAHPSSSRPLANSWRPAAVRMTERVSRSNRRSPRSVSRDWMLRLNAVCDRLARSAAREKCNSSLR